MLSVPMALNAIVKLDIPNILSRSHLPLSPSEILSLTNPNSNPSSSINLHRLLRLLTSHKVFNESVQDGEPRYSLTDIGKTLVDDENGNSFASYVLQHHQEPLVRSWPLVHEAVVDPTGPEPFARANGCPAYEYYGKDEGTNGLMRKAMWGVSIAFIEEFLDVYCGEEKGLDGVETLVDVGGSSGACLWMIMERVKGVCVGVNFDLPEVVQGGIDFPGIIHVGGDMFKHIPQGDAIFMKWILTTWTDEECAQILKNCYDALPEGGKVIACEPVVPETTDNSQRTRALLENDIFVMTIYRSEGKVRTENEFRKIGNSVGFPNFRALYHLDHFYTVLEFKK